MTVIGRERYVLERSLCVLALLVSSYLTLLKLWVRGTPLGCGAAGGGCGSVLSSSWSEFAGLPVSLYAALLYAALLIALLRMPLGSTLSWRLVMLAAFMIAGCAVWFTYLQLTVVQELCAYCLAAHTCGLGLSALLCRRVFRARVLASRQLAGLAATAGLGVLLLALVQARAQSLPSALGHHSEVLVLREDFAALDGKLQLNLADEIVLGDNPVDRVAVIMLDYACPHCRHTHGLLDGRRAGVALCVLPVPLERSCNPFAPERVPPRFAQSCELARLGLAVWRAAPLAYAEFERWLFQETSPRTAADAQRKAAELVGEPELAEALRDRWIDAKLRRNTEAYGAVGEQRRLPVLFTAGRQTLIGRIEDPRQLSLFLARSATD